MKRVPKRLLVPPRPCGAASWAASRRSDSGRGEPRSRETRTRTPRQTELREALRTRCRADSFRIAVLNDPAKQSSATLLQIWYLHQFVLQSSFTKCLGRGAGVCRDVYSDGLQQGCQIKSALSKRLRGVSRGKRQAREIGVGFPKASGKRQHTFLASERQIRGWRAVSAAGLQGAGWHKRSVFVSSQTLATV